jgi:hypothetical protein
VWKEGDESVNGLKEWNKEGMESVLRRGDRKWKGVTNGDVTEETMRWENNTGHRRQSYGNL